MFFLNNSRRPLSVGARDVERVKIQWIENSEMGECGMPKSVVFISYAKEDIAQARKLFNHLKSAGLEPWLDDESLRPGQKWKLEINKAIRNCRYFIALLSSNSVNKRGFVNREIARALEHLDEFPDSEIFVIPVRIDECEPSHEKLSEIQHVDLFPSWEKGIAGLLKSLASDNEDFKDSGKDSNGVILEEWKELAGKWVDSNYPYYIIEGLSDVQKAFIRHPPKDPEIVDSDVKNFLMVSSLHYGGNWYYWVKTSLDTPRILSCLIETLEISYQRVGYRVLYCLQLFEEDHIKEVIENNRTRVSSENSRRIEKYVYGGKVVKYLEKLKENSDSGTVRRAASVLREIRQYIGDADEETPDGKKVFISYNHEDFAFAKKIKTALEKSDINITIDVENLKFGDNIQEFIEQSVKQTDFTIAIISRNSLLSPWVILEALETFMHEHVNNKKKFLPVIIDGSFFEKEFQIEAIKLIEKGIYEIIDVISELSRKFIHARKLENEKARLIDLRNNFDRVLNRLHESLSIDFTSNDNIERNLPKLIQFIKDEI